MDESHNPMYETQENKEIVESDENENNDKIFNKRALPKDAETYELETFEKNLLVIFNHVNIFGFEPRVGTDKDVTALTNTFVNLGFTVVEKTDLTKAEIISELNTLATTDFTDYGCVAVAVLTHGNEDGELKASDIFYSEREIIKRLKVDRNPTLITKPKIVFIQACRGHLEDVIRFESAAVAIPQTAKSQQVYTLPVESDMLVMYSSYAGKASHRTMGSWLVQTLCSKIDELADTEDLESILVHLKRAVAIDHGDDDMEWTQTMESKKQIPVITSTLIRKLYLRKYQ